MNTRSILCIAALSISAVAMSADPTSATPPATPTTLGSAAVPQAPTVVVEKRYFQPAAGEKFDPSEIRQALSELLALKEGAGSNQQIQEKKAALKAAVERGIKKTPKSVIKLLFGFEQFISKRGTASRGPYITDEVRSFIQRDPELAIALVDEVTNERGRSILVNSIGSTWAESDLKAAFAWANQQTDSKIKNEILTGVISIWAKTDLIVALAYAPSLPPGGPQDYLISLAFSKAAGEVNSVQGAIAMIQSLPEGRTKDLAAISISSRMIENDPQAAMNMASGIADTGIRTEAQENVVEEWSQRDPAAATQWINSSSLPQEVKIQLLAKAQPLPNNPLPLPIIVPPSSNR